MRMPKIALSFLWSFLWIVSRIHRVRENMCTMGLRVLIGDDVSRPILMRVVTIDLSRKTCCIKPYITCRIAMYQTLTWMWNVWWRRRYIQGRAISLYKYSKDESTISCFTIYEYSLRGKLACFACKDACAMDVKTITDLVHRNHGVTNCVGAFNRFDVTNLIQEFDTSFLLPPPAIVSTPDSSSKEIHPHKEHADDMSVREFLLLAYLIGRLTPDTVSSMLYRRYSANYVNVFCLDTMSDVILELDAPMNIGGLLGHDKIE